MYTLTEAWKAMYDSLPKGWNGKMYCKETDAKTTMRTNEIGGFLLAYTYTIVLKGQLALVYNGNEITLHPDDIYIYSPGLSVYIVSASEDYHGICLLVDEFTTLEMTALHDLVRIAIMPIVQLNEPKLTLPHDVALSLTKKLQEIISYLNSNHIFKEKILNMLYSIFLLDLQNEQKRVIAHRKMPQRIEEIFIEFIRLLPHHFIEHHDIEFYASSLNISSVYLSRVVKQVSGHTVVDYINQMLIKEATFLLRTSTLSITQIADKLNFADTPSFSKFFSRMKGISPREYRNS
jgi:AraC-like DNA-binding protein